jgi:hypothetical protein
VKRKDDGELVRISMGELRRLQRLDAENRKLRQEVDVMGSILRRVLTSHREQVSLMERYMEEFNGEEKQGAGAVGQDEGKAGAGEPEKGDGDAQGED